MRLQVGAAPLRQASIVIEWYGNHGTDEVVRQTIEEHADSILRALSPLGVEPTVALTGEA